jgi:CRP-like cAMP-binding protein
MKADDQAGSGELTSRGFWDLLSQAEQAALQALSQASAFRADDTICAEGEQATDLLVLTEGWVKILSVTSEHHETVLALRGHGDVIGELAGTPPASGQPPSWPSAPCGHSSSPATGSASSSTPTQAPTGPTGTS